MPKEQKEEQKKETNCVVCKKENQVMRDDRCLSCAAFVEYINTNVKELQKMADAKGLEILGDLFVSKKV